MRCGIPSKLTLVDGKGEEFTVYLGGDPSLVAALQRLHPLPIAQNTPAAPSREALERERKKKQRKESEQKGNDLRSLYTEFGQKTSYDEIVVAEFVTHVTAILLRYPEHNPIAKRRFLAESRLAFQVLLGCIVYIGNPSDSEVVAFLRSEGVTDQEFLDMNQVAQQKNTGTHSVASILNPALLRSRESVLNVVNHFLKRL